eukprot:Rhum_TRINITY_DN12583_c0_g2::Rhum_TRINITY_DN12583_c0_g2_i1::g.52963::m.52963
MSYTRIPKMTVVGLLLTIALYSVALAVPAWVTWSTATSEAQAGVLQYKLETCQNSTDDSIGEWKDLLQIDCGDGDLSKHDEGQCKIFHRVSIARLVFHCIALILLLKAFVECVFFAGTKAASYLYSFVAAVISFVLFLASYSYLRVPCPRDDVSDLQAVVGDSENEYTFKPMFYVMIVGLVFNVFTIFQHLSTCSLRKYEEL